MGAASRPPYRLFFMRAPKWPPYRLFFMGAPKWPPYPQRSSRTGEPGARLDLVVSQRSYSGVS